LLWPGKLHRIRSTGLNPKRVGSPGSNTRKGGKLAKRTVFVSDLSGDPIEDGKGAVISIRFADARKGTYVLDVTDEEAEELGRKGRKQARRGRKPKATS
jgi:hypothetical protein